MKYIRNVERINVDKKRKREEADIEDFLKKLVKVTVNFQKYNK